MEVISMTFDMVKVADEKVRGEEIVSHELDISFKQR